MYISSSEDHVVVNLAVLDLSIDNSAGTIIAGTAEIPGLQDGFGDMAMFDRPTALAIDPNSLYLYVADTNNNLIRQLNLVTDEVVSIAMVGGNPFYMSVYSQYFYVAYGNGIYRADKDGGFIYEGTWSLLFTGSKYC